MRKNKSTDTRIWFIAMLISLASGIIATLLGVSLKTVSVMIVVLAVTIVVFMNNHDKPVSYIVVMIICTIIMTFGSSGIESIFKLPESTPTHTPAITFTPEPMPEHVEGVDQPHQNHVINVWESTSTITPDPTPEYIEEVDHASQNHAVYIWESTSSRYGREIAANIRATGKTISIGNTSTFRFSTDMKKLCRRFEVREDGILSFSLMKNKQDKVDVKDVDDWIVSIVRGDVLVLYEGIVNRNEEEASFECPLSIGNYILVIQRSTGNNDFRIIDIDSTFHRNK